MRTAFARRSSAIALAGVLALAGAACGDNTDDTGTDVNVTEPAQDETTMEQETTTDMETTEDSGSETSSDTATDMETTEEATE